MFDNLKRMANLLANHLSDTDCRNAMTMFNTYSIDIIKECQYLFGLFSFDICVKQKITTCLRKYCVMNNALCSVFSICAQRQIKLHIYICNELKTNLLVGIYIWQSKASRSKPTILWTIQYRSCLSSENFIPQICLVNHVKEQVRAIKPILKQVKLYLSACQTAVVIRRYKES